MKAYSTLEVARLVGVTSATLHRWIRQKRVPAPPLETLGGMRIRMWGRADVEKVKAYKADRYRKGRGRKASTTQRKD
jgi:predicted DNA-binding transcriptional regulator AlpA